MSKLLFQKKKIKNYILRGITKLVCKYRDNIDIIVAVVYLFSLLNCLLRETVCCVPSKLWDNNMKLI